MRRRLGACRQKVRGRKSDAFPLSAPSRLPAYSSVDVCTLVTIAPACLLVLHHVHHLKQLIDQPIVTQGIVSPPFESIGRHIVIVVMAATIEKQASGGVTTSPPVVVQVGEQKTLRVAFAPLEQQPSLGNGGSPPPESHMRTLGALAAWGGRNGTQLGMGRVCFAQDGHTAMA
jgi:hypothetical protein